MQVRGGMRQPKGFGEHSVGEPCTLCALRCLLKTRPRPALEESLELLKSNVSEVTLSEQVGVKRS